MIWIVAALVFASLLLNTLAVQTECMEYNPSFDDFLSLADSKAVEFTYFNPSTDDIRAYVMSEYGLDTQFAILRVGSDYVWLIAKKIDPPISKEETYRGIKIKVLNDVCWAYFNGITIYGKVEAVKGSIDAYYSGETLYNYLKDEGLYTSVKDCDYLKIMKGNYCPFCSSFKLIRAKVVGDKYIFKIYSGGKWKTSVENSFSPIFVEKHRKTLVIGVNGLEVTEIRAV